MGIRATVTSSVDIEYDVNLEGMDSFAGRCGKASYVDYSYEVASTRSSAPALKTLGYLVFVGTLTSPIITTSDSPGEPTLDNPHDIYERQLEVSVRPSKIAVVDVRNQLAWSCSF